MIQAGAVLFPTERGDESSDRNSLLKKAGEPCRQTDPRSADHVCLPSTRGTGSPPVSVTGWLLESPEAQLFFVSTRCPQHLLVSSLLFMLTHLSV